MYSNINLLQDFIDFIKKPSNAAEKEGWQKYFVRIWSLMFMSSMACAMVTACVVFFFLENDSHKMSGFVNNLPAVKIIIYAVLIGPLVEELAFRLPLRLNLIPLSYGLAFLSIFCFTMFFQANYDLPVWLFDYADWRGIGSYAVSSTLIALLFLALLKIPNLFTSVKIILEKNYSVWFYSILIVFAAIHIFNFDNLADVWYIAPFLISPQLSLSVFVSYIRVRIGFRWAYLAHFLNNGLMIGLMLVMKEISPLLVEVMSNFDFTLLQQLKQSDLLLFGFLNLLFFGFFMLVAYYALIVIIQYLQEKSYTSSKQLKIARFLNMLLPGMGQDYLKQDVKAKKYYKYTAFTIFMMIVPLVIPFTYYSINNALIVFALPIFTYLMLTYLSVNDVKKLGLTSNEL